MLTRVEIKGFKCLHDVSVELGAFNVLIGSNDSGKSSFLQALGVPQDLGRLARMGPGDRSVHVWTEDSDGWIALQGGQFFAKRNAQAIVRDSVTLTLERLGLPAETLLKVFATVEALRDAWPDLPGVDDQERPLPPVRRCWSRRVEGTSLAVLYLIGGDGVTVFGVIVEPQRRSTPP